MGDSFLAFAKELYRDGKLKDASIMADTVFRNDPYCPGAQEYAVVYRVLVQATLKRIGTDDDRINWYSVLGIQNHRKATLQTITHRFVKLRKFIHPLTDDGAMEACTLLNKAFEFLSDEKSRLELDQYLPDPKEEDHLSWPRRPPPPPAACRSSVPAAIKGDHRPPARLPPPPLKECSRSSVPVAAKVLSKGGDQRPAAKLPPPTPLKECRETSRSSVPHRPVEKLPPPPPHKESRNNTRRSSIPPAKVISKGYRSPWRSNSRRSVPSVRLSSGEYLNRKDDYSSEIRVTYRRRSRDEYSRTSRVW